MIEAVLFDLGGVLERVAAAPRVETWTGGRIPASEFWARWLAAESVDRFESGKIGAIEFAELAVPELGLSISPGEFLSDFQSWLAGPYEGASDLVAQVRSRGYAVASLSNSNAVHWPIMELHQNTGRAFDANFPSHVLGICKPRPDAFREAALRWGREPSTILFLDDNEVNCDGARLAGMQAQRVAGPVEAWRALVDAGILNAA